MVPGVYIDISRELHQTLKIFILVSWIHQKLLTSILFGFRQIFANISDLESFVAHAHFTRDQLDSLKQFSSSFYTSLLKPYSKFVSFKVVN